MDAHLVEATIKGYLTTMIAIKGAIILLRFDWLIGLIGALLW
jgi:hypothetical protein